MIEANEIIHHEDNKNLIWFSTMEGDYFFSKVLFEEFCDDEEITGIKTADTFSSFDGHGEEEYHFEFEHLLENNKELYAAISLFSQKKSALINHSKVAA